MDVQIVEQWAQDFSIDDVRVTVLYFVKCCFLTCSRFTNKMDKSWNH